MILANFEKAIRSVGTQDIDTKSEAKSTEGKSVIDFLTATQSNIQAGIADSHQLTLTLLD